MSCSQDYLNAIRGYVGYFQSAVLSRLDKYYPAYDENNQRVDEPYQAYGN